ncbi:MAG: prolipoprotein diacylglyceryl transferase [Planctomycetota bacterium]|nr:prolipoprotein diacylglyceryl transferase [Planctomycetota bacterium]
MHPILIDLGPFPLRSFGLMVVLGFLLGAHWFTRLGLRGVADPETLREKLDSVPMWVLGGVIGGARLMYVIVEVLRGSSIGQSFVDDPLKIFFVWEGGLVMYGGAFGGMLGGYWAARKHGLDPRQVLDLGVVVAFMGLAVGRIGCLLVGDDFGSIVPEAYKGLPFPITITVPEELKVGSLFGEANRGQVLWATQIWMSVNAACISALGFRLLRRRRYRGQVALQLMGVYSVMRFLIEGFRGDELRGVWFGGISTSQLVSIVTGLVCLALLVRNRGRVDEDLSPSNPDPTPAGAGA